MGMVSWICARVERVIGFFATVVALVVGVLTLNQQLDTPPAPMVPVPPAPSVSAAAPALPDAVPSDFSAPLAARLASAFAAAGCAPDAVAVADYVQRLTPAAQTSHGAEGALVQLALSAPGGRVTVQGNGRGAAALADARAALLDNIEIALKESNSCG
jgi:hypothetical protein